MKDREFKKLILPPLNNLRKLLGNDNTGLVICILTDMLNKYTKDGDRQMRTLEIKINDFFSAKWNFVKGNFEDED